MVAPLNDLPRLHHQNFMRIHHGGQTVRNDLGGFVLGRTGQFSLNGTLVG